MSACIDRKERVGRESESDMNSSDESACIKERVGMESEGAMNSSDKSACIEERVGSESENDVHHTEDISHNVDDYVAGESEEHANAFIDMGKSLDFSLYDSSPIATTPFNKL